MFDKDRLQEIREAQEMWEAVMDPAGPSAASAQHDPSLDVKALYTPADLGEHDYLRDVGLPGQGPYTRGVHRAMYRGRLWTTRQYAGFASARETNQRFRLLLEEGMAGINIAFDLPTQHGYDSDHPRARGEVGVVGVPVSSLRDLETLFDGIPVDRVSPANAINGPAAVILAMYVALAERQNVPPARLAGSTQNDILKEFLARGTYIFPPTPSLRLATDVIEYCARHLPRWNFINVCGYHIREAGGTLAQEVGFAFADAVTYVEAVRTRGLDIDAFAPRFAWNFTAGTNLFEEAAKFRAMRRLWARLVRERWGARRPESCLFRTGAGSGASQLTAQQPENNIVRVALNALAAVLGGAQSLHTAAYDEALALPTEASVRLALRTQQVLAHEAGVANVIDPLAGSYYVESLTDQIEQRARDLMDEVERRGGMVRAIELGWPQQQIADASWRLQQEIESGERIVVGVNRFVEDTPHHVPMHRHAERVEVERAAELAALRAERDPAAVGCALDKLSQAAATTVNVMPFLIEAVKAYATVGEISDVLRKAFGVHTENTRY